MSDEIIKGLQSVEPADNWIDQELLTKAVAAIEAERALADDLADVLSTPIDSVGGKWYAEVERVLTRYRAARP